jgi:hypothetical protein
MSCENDSQRMNNNGKLYLLHKQGDLKTRAPRFSKLSVRYVDASYVLQTYRVGLDVLANVRTSRFGDPRWTGLTPARPNAPGVSGILGWNRLSSLAGCALGGKMGGVGGLGMVEDQTSGRRTAVC